MTTNIAIFALAAFFEIAGCFAFWLWVRRGAAPVVVLLGIASLIGFALALTRIDSTFAGRAYAAYGGIYIAASLVWLWVVEDQTPTRTDTVDGDEFASRSTIWWSGDWFNSLPDSAAGGPLKIAR